MSIFEKLDSDHCENICRTKILKRDEMWCGDHAKARRTQKKNPLSVSQENRLQDMSVEELVALFTSVALKEYDATIYWQTAKYNRLYDEMSAIKNELKSRGDDERRALTSLYRHSNLMVRLQAARANLALGYTEARNVIQSIADSGDQPLAGHAGMTLSNLDRGVYKPT